MLFGQINKLRLTVPRPNSKEDLLIISQQKYNDLLTLVSSFSIEESAIDFGFDHRDKNIRDILAHLYHWHGLFLTWYELGMGGEKPEMPSSGFTWKTTVDLNKVIWGQYQDTSLQEIKKLLDDSFSDVHELIKKHTNEELSEKKKYFWTGSTSLGSYLISATSSHYDWAIKLLKKQKRYLK